MSDNTPSALETETNKQGGSQGCCVPCMMWSCLVFGIVFLILGVVGGMIAATEIKKLVAKSIIDAYIIEDDDVDKDFYEGDEEYFSIVDQAWVYSVTNEDEVIAGAPPKFEKIGPFYGKTETETVHWEFTDDKSEVNVYAKTTKAEITPGPIASTEACVFDIWIASFFGGVELHPDPATKAQLQGLGVQTMQGVGATVIQCLPIEKLMYDNVHPVATTINAQLGQKRFSEHAEISATYVKPENYDVDLIDPDTYKTGRNTASTEDVYTDAWTVVEGDGKNLTLWYGDLAPKIKSGRYVPKGIEGEPGHAKYQTGTADHPNVYLQKDQTIWQYMSLFTNVAPFISTGETQKITCSDCGDVDATALRYELDFNNMKMGASLDSTLPGAEEPNFVTLDHTINLFPITQQNAIVSPAKAYNVQALEYLRGNVFGLADDMPAEEDSPWMAFSEVAGLPMGFQHSWSLHAMVKNYDLPDLVEPLATGTGLTTAASFATATNFQFYAPVLDGYSRLELTKKGVEAYSMLEDIDGVMGMVKLYGIIAGIICMVIGCGTGGGIYCCCYKR